MGTALATHCCASEEEDKPEALKNLKKERGAGVSLSAGFTSLCNEDSASRLRGCGVRQRQSGQAAVD